MTHEQFWKLYESKQIKYKLFAYENPEADNGELALGEVIAFEYDGKFYMRVCKNFSPKGYRKRYKNGGWSSGVFKVFETKQSANAYFKKAFNGYRLVRCSE